jgi:hypothetical protein
MNSVKEILIFSVLIISCVIAAILLGSPKTKNDRSEFVTHDFSGYESVFLIYPDKKSGQHLTVELTSEEAMEWQKKLEEFCVKSGTVTQAIYWGSLEMKGLNKGILRIDLLTAKAADGSRLPSDFKGAISMNGALYSQAPGARP